MVEKIKSLLQEIEEINGKVNLFAVLKMDEFTERWTVLLSASWTKEETLRENFIFLRSLMIEKFSDEEMSTVAKIIVATGDEHIVQELLKFKTGTVIDSDQRINGNIVHEAFILKSS